MGGGYSIHIEKQERFVRDNYQDFKDKLPEYSQEQIEGKMRQLYAGIDEDYENRNSYIIQHNWTNAKNSFLRN